MCTRTYCAETAGVSNLFCPHGERLSRRCSIIYFKAVHAYSFFFIFFFSRVYAHRKIPSSSARIFLPRLFCRRARTSPPKRRKHTRSVYTRRFGSACHSSLAKRAVVRRRHFEIRFRPRSLRTKSQPVILVPPTHGTYLLRVL